MHRAMSEKPKEHAFQACRRLTAFLECSNPSPFAMLRSTVGGSGIGFRPRFLRLLSYSTRPSYVLFFRNLLAAVTIPPMANSARVVGSGTGRSVKYTFGSVFSPKSFTENLIG